MFKPILLKAFSPNTHGYRGPLTVIACWVEMTKVFENCKLCFNGIMSKKLSFHMLLCYKANFRWPNERSSFCCLIQEGIEHSTTRNPGTTKANFHPFKVHLFIHSIFTSRYTRGVWKVSDLIKIQDIFSDFFKT